MTTSLYRKVLHDRRDLYETAINNGIYTPFLLPWDLIPLLLLLLGVMLTPRFSRTVAKSYRWGCFLLVMLYEIYRWPYVRTIGLAVGYGIGLSGFWGIVMSFNLLILHDPGRDFRRIECRPNSEQESTSANGYSGKVDTASESVETIERTSLHAQNRTVEILQQEGSRTLVWQGMPSTTYHLFDWTLDLLTSFRGINWDFRIPIKTYIAPPPDVNTLSMSESVRKSNSRATKKLQQTALLNTAYYYLILDAFKTFLMTDPYWLGISPLDSPSAWPWLVGLETTVPGITRFVRLLISIGSVVSALTFIFSLNPLFFGVVVPFCLGNKLHEYTRCPLTEAWLYPPQWGNMLESLAGKGLAGMWSTWWHQIFRYGISEPSKALIKYLGMDTRGRTARATQLFIGFGLTGGIHAVASSTTFSIVPSEPLRPLLFFFCQAIGITVQTETSKFLISRLGLERQRRLRQVGNVVFVAAFLWLTGPLLADDFSKCGIWLFEPLPVSLFRGLGFGPADCWSPWLQYAERSKWIGWYKGRHWHETGLAIY